MPRRMSHGSRAQNHVAGAAHKGAAGTKGFILTPADPKCYRAGTLPKGTRESSGGKQKFGKGPEGCIGVF